MLSKFGWPVWRRAAAAALLGLVCGVSVAADSLRELASEAAAAREATRSEIAGSNAMAIPLGLSGGCRVVAAWYMERPRGILNFRICGDQVSGGWMVAHYPKTAEARQEVSGVLRRAVLLATADGAHEEFKLSARRLEGEDGGISCATELIITVEGLVAYYGIQEACR